MGKFAFKTTGTLVEKRGNTFEDSAITEDTSSLAILSTTDRKIRKKALKVARRDVQITTEAVAELAKGRKRKTSEEADKSSGPVEKPSKKRRKNRTEFADPRNDEGLNGQSRRALEYVFLQMNKPEKWKFNKARQNWLIRNVWNPEAIPDTYFPLVTKYLSLVRGGPRDRLAQACESCLKETEEGERSTEFSSTAASTTSPVPRSILKTAPGPLIVVSSASESKPAADVAVRPSTPEASPFTIRKKRAQSLLEALRSSDSNT